MSRNLCKTECDFCFGVVKLDEQSREIRKEEAGIYYEAHGGYGYAGMLCANATCSDCRAKYLAWISMEKCPGYGSWRDREIPERGFSDLSFRASFNDEPGEEDLPDFRIVEEQATHEECVLLQAHSATVRRRKLWPRCPDTGRKIHHCYGCECARPEGRGCKHDLPEAVT